MKRPALPFPLLPLAHSDRVCMCVYVRMCAAPAPAAVPATVFGDFTDLTTSGLSRSIAARLAHSKQTVPHYTLTADINLDSLLSLRARVRRVLVCVDACVHVLCWFYLSPCARTGVLTVPRGICS